MGLLYYLFSAHHWTLEQLRGLYNAPTAQHDLILALASYEAGRKYNSSGRALERVRITKKTG